jgi:hypothetical protein
MLALGQCEQEPVEPCSSGNENDIICHSPQGSLPLVCRHAPMFVILLVNVRRSNRHTSFYSNTPIEPWQPHPIAEGVREHTRIHIASTDVYEGCEEAKERRVCELEQRAEDSNQERDFRVRDAELVKVVQVCYAKVQRRQEDNLLSGEMAQHMKGYNAGSPDELFTNGTLRSSAAAMKHRGRTCHYVVPVADPAT